MSTLKTTNIAHPSSASNNIVLDSSGNVVLQAGSASTPALQPSGDTNTGIFFPAADTIAFAEGGAEAMRIDSSGRVGIGTTTPSFKLHSYDTAAAQGFFNGWSSGGTYDAAGAIRFGNQTGYQGRVDYDPSGNTNFIFENSYLNGSISWKINGGEKARLNPAGQLLVGTSTSQGSYNLQCFGTGVWGQGAYVNGSDASIKQNINDISSSLEVVKSLRAVTFEYKPEYSQDQTVQAGFIAQELQQAMAGQKYLDGIVQQGTNHLNVAYQSIIPVLTKALQEAIAKIETLEAKVAALEAS